MAVDLLTGATAGGDARGDRFSGFENILGSAFADTLTGDNGNNNLKGNDGDDRLYGLGGNDHLVGGAGNDFIDGGDGNDLIEGGTGSDTLAGGAGTDTLSYATSTAGVVVDLSRVSVSGRQFVSGGDATGDHVSGFENIRGGAFADHLTGDAGSNVLEGRGGGDILAGGGGHDRFVFSGLDIGSVATITDFSHGDRIDLRGIDAIAGGDDDAFSFIGEAAFTAAGQIRLWFDGHDTHVEASGMAFSLVLTGVRPAGLGVSDFFL